MGSAIRSFIDAILYPFRLLASVPSSVISSPRRILGLSLQARAALLLFFGLLFIAIIWAVLRSLLSERVQWEGFLKAELPAVCILVIAIPIVVVFAR